MRVKQLHGGCSLLGVLELADARLEPRDVFPEELGACLALAVVVLACISFLRANTLLA
jgi:hypothetical protein